MKRHFDKRYIAVTSMRFHRVFPILRFKYREASEWKSKYKLRAGNFDLLISSQFFAASTSFCQKSILSSFISVQFHRGHCLPATTTKTRYSVQMRCPAFQNCLTFTSTSLDIRATDHTSSYHVISICGWFALPSLWSCAIYLKLHVSYVSHLSGLCIGSQMTFHPDIILFGFSFSLFCPFWSCLLFTFGFHGWPATAWSHRFDPYLAAALSWFAVWFGAISSNAGIFTFLGTTTCHCPQEQQLTMLYAGKSLSWCLASSWTATNLIRQNPTTIPPLLLWPAPDRHAKAIPIASCNTTQWEAPTMQWWK